MLLRSNGAHIAGTPEGGFMSRETSEVFELIYNMYVNLRVAKPWDITSWDINNRYSDSSVAFFPVAHWVLNTASEHYGGGADVPLPFEIGVVPWPVGPNGNKDTNYQNYVQGNYYLIPRGVEDPAQVYQAFFDLRNWYGGVWTNTRTFDVIDDDDESVSWGEQQYLAAARGNTVLGENNVRLTNWMKHRASFDPWEGLIPIISAAEVGSFSMEYLMLGDFTPAQFQETFKQSVENALRTVYR
jgi:ABC-type glycerol-3-phosphate transport system substrate-binding protein